MLNIQLNYPGLKITGCQKPGHILEMTGHKIELLSEKAYIVGKILQIYFISFVYLNGNSLLCESGKH